MRHLILLPALLFLLLAPTQSRADGTILDQLKTLPLKEGVMLDISHKRVLNTLGFGVLGYKDVEVDLAYIGVDGLGAVLNYNLKNLPVANVPILKYTQYLNIGYGVGYRTMAIADVTNNPKSDNQFIQGPVLFIKLNF